ncbi:hypothetical protein LTR36_006501 [Oleoguttula mirabilis]|uniref:Phytochrome n=1 Tax=Oleoguttula mirabilis TaxID=1507867 RepID=A0AAV9JV87_9PEZI|nr:hypothetical protein LTR36_006501 [Oleoguttula mirabilis]
MSAEQQRRQDQRAGVSTDDVSPLSAGWSSSSPASQPSDSRARRPSSSPTSQRPDLQSIRSPTSALDNPLSPAAADRVFPIRSVVSVDPAPTPSARPEYRPDGYFHIVSHFRSRSASRGDGGASEQAKPANIRQTTAERRRSSREQRDDAKQQHSRQSSTSTTGEPQQGAQPSPLSSRPLARHQPELFQEIVAESGSSAAPSEDSPSAQGSSAKSLRNNMDEMGGLLTARFKHVVTEGGHAIITGRDGETLQRCEDEPIHIPGAVQGFGLLIALEEQSEGRLIVRVVSENSRRMTGYTPRQLFALESFTDILSEEQADNLLDHVDFIRDEDADVTANGPEVFTMSIRTPQKRNLKMWCAMHINLRNPNLVICEFELEDDTVNPLVPANEATPEPAEDTLQATPTNEEVAESTQNSSKPLRVLRSARKRKGEAAAMEVLVSHNNIMSQVQEQLAAAPNLETFLKILVGVIKELTGFHRVMIYQFDHLWNGRVVTELVDPRATRDLYKGLNFPASDIPTQARDLYKVNKVRLLYDRDQETARLVCRTVEDLETPLDLTYSYLRAMSPIHVKYLANMAVRSSMSVSINAFDELWGLIACHSYGSKGMRVSFPIRKMCRLVGDSASRNIERLSYASRLQARKLINTVPTQNNPSGYIVASSEDLLRLFDADFGLLCIHGETKILGHIEQSQEALAMLEYLRMRQITSVMTSQDIKQDFPDLRYAPGFSVIAGMLLVPLSARGQDFIVFFRKGQLREVKWAGNPYEKFVVEGTEGYLEPRKSFKTWSETVVGKCREWTEEEIETAAVLCLVYGKFIEVWREKERALENSQLTRLLLANSAHEVRTPLNAIINYLEIALEGTLDQETRDNLAKSHSASKSLIYVINDLLDLTKTEEGGELTKDEIFNLRGTLEEATNVFKGDVKRKGIEYEVIYHPGLPRHVIGDQRRVRQAISNVTANAVQNTTQGGIKVEMYLTSREDSHCEVEIAVTDTGVGMSANKLDKLFRELEQVQSESDHNLNEAIIPDPESKAMQEIREKGSRALGLGLALVARIVRNMNGQLRLKSEEGRGSRFVIQFPFELPEDEPGPRSVEGSDDSQGSTTPVGLAPKGTPTPPDAGEVTLVERSSATSKDGLSERGNSAALSRKNSNESLHSKKSIGSLDSVRSNHSRSSGISGMSRGSEADRLISAISEPHNALRSSSRGVGSGNGGSSGSGGSGSGHGGGGQSTLSSRPRLFRGNTTAAPELSGSPLRNKPQSMNTALAPTNMQVQRATKPGEAIVTGQGQPVRAVKVPEDDGAASPGGTSKIPSAPAAELPHSDHSNLPQTSDKPATADHMRVLVAEDDPVNSRIIEKRLEKLGHEVYLTLNGEECSSTYGDKSGFFDIILMDMQMPIVDGLTATKMIRSFEKSHPTHMLSTRASLNRRVPIIAVSASLVEKERSMYIEGGFDGWILKPIAFNRLSEIMTGIVDPRVRWKNLYKPGRWENGGWFDKTQKDVFAADTTPSEEPPTSAPGHKADNEGVKIAAASDDPGVKEEGESVQSQEQQRMLAAQAREKEEEAKPVAKSGLDVEQEESPDSGLTITLGRRHATPPPATPDLEMEQ